MRRSCQGEKIVCKAIKVECCRFGRNCCVEVAVPYPALVWGRPDAWTSRESRSRAWGETVSLSLQNSAPLHGAFGRQKEQDKDVKE